MKVALVRGGFLNNFEVQNYSESNRSIKITAMSSLQSIHQKFSLPVVKLPSLYDLGFPTWVANRTLGDRQLLLGLEKAVIGFDVVHTADSHYYYSYQLAKMRRNGSIKRLVATSWETIPFNNESAAAKKRNKYFSMKYVDRFLCYTSRAKKCLITEGVMAGKITVIPLGVDLNKFKPASLSSARTKKDKVRILFTGRDVPEKGLLDLRTSINYLIEVGKVELLVAGNVPYERMPEVYRLADVFVMPSKTTKTWEEQYGMALIEAMASGLPIVAYGSGSIPDILGKAGIVVDEGDVKALEKKLTELVNYPHKRKALGILARKRAEKHFDSRIFAKKLDAFYRSVMK